MDIGNHWIPEKIVMLTTRSNNNSDNYTNKRKKKLLIIHAVVFTVFLFLEICDCIIFLSLVVSRMWLNKVQITNQETVLKSVCPSGMIW